MKGSLYTPIDRFGSTVKVDLPTINRYLRVLDRLRVVDPVFYGEVIQQLCDPLGVIAEAIEPIETRPMTMLTPGEAAWRSLARTTV